MNFFFDFYYEDVTKIFSMETAFARKSQKPNQWLSSEL